MLTMQHKIETFKCHGHTHLALPLSGTVDEQRTIRHIPQYVSSKSIRVQIGTSALSLGCVGLNSDSLISKHTLELIQSSEGGSVTGLF